MHKIIVRLSPRPAIKATPRALITLFVAAQVATAQTGAIKDAKGERDGERREGN